MSEYLLYTAPILAGTELNWALLATLAIQVYAFHTCFPNEGRWMKILVYTVFPFELAQTAVSTHYAYWVLALGWGNTTHLKILPWSCLATPIFTGITAALVQIFFAWRIYLLMLKTVWARLVAAVIVLLALTQGVMIFIIVAQFARETAFSNVVKIKVGVKAWLMITAICDLLITSTLIVIFFQYRMQMSSEERRTDTFMMKLILNTVETGAVTSAAALIYLVLFLLYPETNLEEMLTFILGKLYANVLLFSLNVRVGGARRRFWTNHMIEAQHEVGTLTSLYPVYTTHTASDCIDSHSG
ncbi:hypothetical protein B0H19DRAFT_479568 [Mycena capillaripes]|nr:hypothetical protein B0H19DRAFT_479568 [Mycena capillaripes]